MTAPMTVNMGLNGPAAKPITWPRRVKICFRTGPFLPIISGHFSEFVERSIPLSRNPSQPLGAFPRLRLRRNRRDAWTRRLVAETVLTAADFLWPVFVHDAAEARVPI